MSGVEKYDEVLMNVAGQCGGIQPLFDVIFSFLYRKTDFFHIMQPGDNMGFSEGVAEKILLSAFHKYQKHAEKARQELQRDSTRRQSPGAAVKPVDSEGTPKKEQQSSSQKSDQSRPDTTQSKESVVATAPVQPPETAASEPKAASAPAASVPHLATGADVPYNGGKTDRYTWEQTLHDVTIQVPVPEGTRAKDIICVISKSKLHLKIRGQPDAIIDKSYPCDARNGKEIWEKVRVGECTWALEQAGSGRPRVSVYLEKERECWWKSALEGDQEIDTTKVDSTRSLYEYDGETQGAIRKIMFDEEQKRKGLPTSDEIQNEDLLRKAWDAEGSPFKGTPFDPSAINFKTGGGGGRMELPP